jgi:hypothetical protein
VSEKCFLDCDSLATLRFESPARVRSLCDLPPHCGPVDIPDSVERMILSTDPDGHTEYVVNFGHDSRLSQIQFGAKADLITDPEHSHFAVDSRKAWERWLKEAAGESSASRVDYGFGAAPPPIPRAFLRFAPRTLKKFRAEEEFVPKVFGRGFVAIASSTIGDILEHSIDDEDDDDFW